MAGFVYYVIHVMTPSTAVFFMSNGMQGVYSKMLGGIYNRKYYCREGGYCCRWKKGCVWGKIKREERNIFPNYASVFVEENNATMVTW